MKATARATISPGGGDAEGGEKNSRAKAQRLAEGAAIRDIVLSIVRQACEQGVELDLAAAVVLGVGAKGLRLALGPAEAARCVRAMADQVAADTGAPAH